MARNTSGLRRGGPGRPKGSKNKSTVEVRDLARRLVLDDEYLASVRKRMLDGKLAPAVECLLWQYGFGKPKDTVEVNVDREVITVITAPIATQPNEAHALPALASQRSDLAVHASDPRVIDCNYGRVPSSDGQKLRR